MQRLRRLLVKPGARRAEGAFVAEGVRLAEEALAAGAAIESVYWAPGAPIGLIESLLSTGARGFELAPGVLERVADTVTPQPVMTVVGAAPVPLDALSNETMLVVCAEVRDPGNAGTVLRAARAAGAGGVVSCAGSVDPYNPKVVRASAGAVFSLPVAVGGDVIEVMEQIGTWGLRRLAAVADGGEDYAGTDLSSPFALLLGNEAHGLSDPAMAGVDARVTVPMAPGSESLNVAVAAGVICFEAARQRRMR